MTACICTQKLQRWIHNTNSCGHKQEVVNIYLSCWVTKSFSRPHWYLTWTLLLPTRQLRLREVACLILRSCPSCPSFRTYLAFPLRPLREDANTSWCHGSHRTLSLPSLLVRASPSRTLDPLPRSSYDYLTRAGDPGTTNVIIQDVSQSLQGTHYQAKCLSGPRFTIKRRCTCTLISASCRRNITLCTWNTKERQQRPSTSCFIMLLNWLAFLQSGIAKPCRLLSSGVWFGIVLV